MVAPKPPVERNRPYHETHRDLIASAVKIISQHGPAGLSFALLAREVGIDRTTIYYHFKNKDALLGEVRAWSANELARGFSLEGTPRERVRYTIRYALENPELTKLWIADLLDPAIGIQQIYPMWEDVVRGIGVQMDGNLSGARPDVFFLNMLISAVIAPIVFGQKVDRGKSVDEVVDLFEAEVLRVFTSTGIGV